MEIYQTTTPIERMRYRTPGDYLYRLNHDLFRFIIAEMGNTDYEFLIFRHELKEAYLCWKAGIKEEDISAFDIMFEEERNQGLHGTEDEPGNDPRAPYYKQHQIATADEMRDCVDLGVDWCEYENAVIKILKEG
jgi:hypothetical protein